MAVGPTIQDVLDRIDSLEATLFDVALLRQQYCNLGDNYNAFICGINWVSQTVTPQEDYKVLLTKLKLYRVGQPGNVIISIQATSEGLPIGPDLCSVILDGNSFTTDIMGLWYPASFGLGLLQLKDTKHAIVVRAPDGDIDNSVVWRYNVNNDSYLGGQRIGSADSGVSWTPAYGNLMFEEYTNSSLSDLHREIIGVRSDLGDLHQHLLFVPVDITTIDQRLDSGEIKVYSESKHARLG